MTRAALFTGNLGLDPAAHVASRPPQALHTTLDLEPLGGVSMETLLDNRRGKFCRSSLRPPLALYECENVASLVV